MSRHISHQYQSEKFSLNFIQNNLSVFLVIAALAFLGLIMKMQFSTQNPYAQINTETEANSFVYNMPRPTSNIKEFNFSDRDVDVEFTSNGISNSDEEKKSIEDKTQKVVKNPNPTDKSSNKTEKKNADNKKKSPSLTTRVVDTSRVGSSPLSSALIESQENISPEPATEIAYPPAQARKADNTNDQDNSKKDDVATLSVSEWRNLIMNKPTRTVATELTDAYHEGDIDKDSYYKIISDLLTDNSNDRAEVAIYMLSLDSSSEAFELMVQTSPSLNEEIKQKLKPLIEDFSNSDKLSKISNVLNSSESLVLNEALRIIEIAVQNRNNKEQAASERETRRIASRAASNNQFLQLLPGLKKLTKNSNTTIAKEAQSLADKIQLLREE